MQVLAYGVIASALKIWTLGTGKTLAKKEIATLRSLGLQVGRTCRIAEAGAIYRGDQRLEIVIARSHQELSALLDTSRFTYRIFEL